MSGKAKEAVRRGSGNIFADLGLADAETHLLKARLVSRLQSLIEGRGLTQAQAAEVMGIGQPDVSRMLRGQFRDFSVERLMRFLTAFGCDVDIVIQEKGKKAKAETIRLAPAAE
jgi:predicted XRE-type DNA-binding protein